MTSTDKLNNPRPFIIKPLEAYDSPFSLDSILNDSRNQTNPKAISDFETIEKGIIISNPCELQKEIFCKVTKRCDTTHRKKYRLRPGIGENIVKLLLEGNHPSKVAELLGISTSLEQYHRQKAIDDHVISLKKGFYPQVYEKGPCYKEGLYKYRKGRRSLKFVNPVVRVHPGNGGYFRIKVEKEGDLHSINHHGTEIKLFKKEPVGKNGEKHFNCQIKIPLELYNFNDVNATIVFYPYSKIKIPGGRLEVSPPEIMVYESQLTSIQFGKELFKPMIDYVIKILSNSGGWKFGEILYQGEEIHYAFARSVVQPLLPDLWDNPYIHSLRRGDKESDYPLFKDLSVIEGELETTSLDVAIKLIKILSSKYNAIIDGRCEK